MKNKYNDKSIVFSIISITITAMISVADNSIIHEKEGLQGLINVHKYKEVGCETRSFWALYNTVQDQAENISVALPSCIQNYFLII